MRPWGPSTPTAGEAATAAGGRGTRVGAKIAHVCGLWRASDSSRGCGANCCKMNALRVPRNGVVAAGGAVDAAGSPSGCRSCSRRCHKPGQAGGQATAGCHNQLMGADCHCQGRGVQVVAARAVGCQGRRRWLGLAAQQHQGRWHVRGTHVCVHDLTCAHDESARQVRYSATTAGRAPACLHTSSPTVVACRCQTCSLGYDSCPGHFGHIELPLPVYNPLVFG